MDKYDAFLDGPAPGDKYDAFLDGPDPSAPVTPQKQNSLPYEVGRQIVGGLVVDLPKMVGGAGEWFSPEGSSTQEFFRHGKENWGARPEGWEPQTEGRSTVGKALVTGARSLAPSAAGIAAVPVAAAVAPALGTAGATIAGGAAIAGLFGGSQAQETYDKGIKAGLSPEEAKSAGWKTGAIEGLGEVVADVTGAKLMTGAGKGVRALLGKDTVGEALRTATDPRWAGQFAKNWAANAAIQSGTEYGQNYGETAVENAYGISKDSPHEQGKEGALAAMGMSALLGPFAAVGHVRSARQREAMQNILTSPDAPLELKQQVGQYLHDNVVVPAVGEEYGKQWLDSFNEQAVQDRDAQSIGYTQATSDATVADNTDLLYETPASRTNARFGMSAASESSWGGAPITFNNEDTGPLAGVNEPVDPVDVLGMPASAASGPATPIQMRQDVAQAATAQPAATRYDIFGMPITEATPDAVHPDKQAPIQQPAKTKQAKPGTKAALKETLDQQLADGTITQDQHIEATNAVDTSRTYAKAKAGVESALQPQAPAGVTPIAETKLTAKQQPVFDHMVKAMQDGRMDDVVDAQGVIQYQKIADAVGLDHRGKAKSFIDHIVKRIAKANGTTVEGLKAALRERAAQTRETEAATEDKLGLSPAMQDSQVNHEDLFGSEGGAESNMQIINSVGGSSQKGHIAADNSDLPTTVNANATERETADQKKEAARRFDAEIEAARHQKRKNAEYAFSQLVNRSEDLEGEAEQALSNEFGQEAVETAQDQWDDYAHRMMVEGTPTPGFELLPHNLQRQVLRRMDTWLSSPVERRSLVSLWDSFDNIGESYVDTGRRSDGVPALENAEGRSGQARSALPAPEARTGEIQTAPATEPGSGQTLGGTESEQASTGSNSESQDEVGFTPQYIAQRWHDYAQRWGLPKLAQLDEDQQQELLAAYDEDSLQSAISAVRDEVENPEQSETKFSKGTVQDRLAQEIARWKQVVSDYLDRTLDRTKTYTMLSSTPASMQAMGLPNMEVRTGPHMLDHANIRLSASQLEELPRQLANPQLVYIHNGNNGMSINFVTDIGTGSGPVVIALKPNQHVSEAGNAHFVATVINVRPDRIVSEMRNGNGIFVASKDVFPGLRSAIDTAQKQKGREASELRAQMARNYGIASVTKRLLFPSDLVKLVEDGRAQFSEGDGGSSTTEAVNNVVNELVGKSHPRIKVVQSVDELTPAERQAAERDAGRQLSQDEWGQVQAFVVGGKAYFIAGNIPAGAERAVFMHEIGAHLGLEKLLTKEQFKRLVGKIDEWAARNDDSQESSIAKAALQRVAEAGDNESMTDSEKVAYFVEEAVKAGVDPTAVKYNSELGRWFRTLWAAFKTAIRRLTGEANFAKFNAQDVVNLAYGAAKLELTGTWHGTAADLRNFNHKYMGTGEANAGVGERTKNVGAFGWGTYLAQRPGIAKGYWEADMRRKGGQLRIEEKYNSLLGTNVYSVMDGFDLVKRFNSKDAAEKFYRENKREGSLMRVDTAVHDDEFLDWDKPLSEQSEVVRDKLLADPNLRYRVEKFGDYIEGWKGSLAYKQLEENLGSDKAASEYLDSIGIKGIKFLDSQSRHDSETYITDMHGGTLSNQEYSALEKRGIATYEYGKGWSLNPEWKAMLEEVARKDPSSWVGRMKDFELKVESPPEQTHNLVIFNDKNIQRVATEVGADRERTKFSKASTQKFIDENIPGPYQESATRISGTLRDLLKRGTYAVAFGHDLVDMIRPILPSAKKYFDLMSQKGATLTKLESNIDAIMERSSKVKDRAALNKFIADSTVSGKWGYKIDPNSKVVVDPEMERRFKALSPEAQQVAKDIFKHGYETVNKLRDMIRTEIEAGEKEGVPKEEVMRQLRLLDAKFPSMTGPYAPLSRFGNYVVVGKSAAFVDAKQRNDQKWIDANESNPNHYYVEFFDSQGQADVAKRRIERQFYGGEVTAAAKQSDAVQAEAPWSVMRRLRTQIDNEFGKNSKEAGKLRGLLNDLYLSTLTEASARQHYQSRRKVAGYNPDMLRSFASKGRADAYFMSSLEYTGQVSDALADMRSEAKEEGKPELREDRTRALNEVLKRYAASMDYRPTPIMDKLASGTGIWMLLTNPAYYFQNSLQPFMMTLPWLAGKHGYAKSWNALLGAYRAISKGGLDIDKMNISDAERAMLHNLRDNGILDIGIQRELGHWTKDGDEGAFSKGMSTVAFKLNTAVQKLEMVNRITSALAAYRLTGSEKDAADTIRITHGDYGSFNAPRPFKAPGAKLLLQFRKFQLIQLSMLARMVNGSFSGASGPERAAARKAMAFTLAHHFAMAGFLGLPAANLIGLAVTAALGSGDDPKDEEYLLRKWIDNEAVSNLLLKGIPASLGVDISTKVGMGNVTSVLPFSKADPMSRQGFSDTVFQLLGPAAALGQRFADGFGLMRQGDYWKGLEQMTPSLISNGMKGVRQATEGVTLRNGDQVLTPDEYGLLNGMLQGLGMTSTEMGQRMRRQGDAIQFSKDFMAHATELKHRYTEAYKEGDGETLSDIRAQWRELQDAERRNGFKASPMSDLVKAPVEQRKRERMSIGGVEAKKNNRQFVRTDSGI